VPLRVVPPGSPASKEALNIPVERFLTSLRFENKGKLDDLGLEMHIIALDSGD